QGCAAVVVCSMALMLVQPLDAALAEITRLLVPGGTLIALLPASRPLTSADAVRYGHLLFALRSWRLRYPNDSKLANLRAMLSRASLTLIAEERRRFSYAVTSPGMGLRFVQSLYLPGQSPQRLQAAAKVAERWVGKELGLPLRRILAVRQ
ncbi:MAG: hypothetical protein ACRDQW_17840, partial [Haloechinothrix sp.]